MSKEQGSTKAARNLVVLCDGTWNREDNKDITNIAKLYGELVVAKALHQINKEQAVNELNEVKTALTAIRTWARLNHIPPHQLTHELIEYLSERRKKIPEIGGLGETEIQIFANRISHLKKQLHTHAHRLQCPIVQNPDQAEHDVHNVQEPLNPRQIIQNIKRHKDHIQQSLQRLEESETTWLSWLWSGLKYQSLQLIKLPSKIFNWIQYFYKDQSPEEYKTQLLQIMNAEQHHFKSEYIQDLGLLSALAELEEQYHLVQGDDERLDARFDEMEEEINAPASEEQPSPDNQIIYYDRGVGTWGAFSRYISGATGIGLELNIKQAYSFLAQHYQAGDKIFVFGFSRGAYTVRSLLGMIHKVGLLHTEHVNEHSIEKAFRLYRKGNAEKIAAFRQKYQTQEVVSQFLGVFDTVGAMGLPDADALNNFQYGFHDTQTRGVKHARHALALDEHREDFAETRMSSPETGEFVDIEQRWFAGAHSDVGGGYAEHGLSDCARMWMWREAAKAGLSLPAGYFPSGFFPHQKFTMNPNPFDTRHDSRYRGWWSMGGTVRSDHVRQVGLENNEIIDSSVVMRLDEAYIKNETNNGLYQSRAIEKTQLNAIIEDDVVSGYRVA